MSDLSQQLKLFGSKLQEEISQHQAEYDRWHNYKRDYEALEQQLSTLPGTVSKQAMIPMGPLAFMPGKIIHTNEILVLLGDKYYAERTAKQAMEIVGRRKEVVEESLRLVEAQLNSAKAKRSSVFDSMQQTQYNEEGLPIMDIREELPLETPNEKTEDKGKGKLIQNTTTPSTTEYELPESVLRARRMMKEADEKIKQRKASQSQEDKALFDLLQELEEEEEELEAAGIDNVIEKPPIYTKFMNAAKEEEEKRAVKNKLGSGSNSDFSDDDEDDFDEDDERYDREIADNLFDKFSDNPLEGVVDQEDFTTYGDEQPEEEELDEDIQTMTSSVKEMFIEPEQQKRETAKVIDKGFDDEEDTERSTPKLETKKKDKKKKVTFAASVQPTQRELDEEEEGQDRTTTVQSTIKSPADIFKVIRKTQTSSSRSNNDSDDYPSLDDEESKDKPINNVDINELIKAARGYSKEAIYQPTDGETLIPVVKENFPSPSESSEANASESISKIATQKKSNSKLDNKIMKGAVMERDITPVDPEAVEDDMDLREITASYQQKRLNMLAATGGFSFEPKPEFEVFDEELPLPRKEDANKGANAEEDIPEVKPKKISRFKAARLGMRVDDTNM